MHQVTAAEGFVLAACASGLAASTDRGVNWSTRDDGLERVYARAVAISGDAVLLSASDGPRGGHAAVYRGAVADGPLERCTDEPFDGNIDSHCLDALPDGTAAAFGTADGRLFASVDEGATWQDAGTVPGAVRSVLLI